MKRRLMIILALAGMFLMSNCSDKSVAKYPFSPRQAKKIFEAKSSASITPIETKEHAISQSARLEAPNQQKKKKS